MFACVLDDTNGECCVGDAGACDAKISDNSATHTFPMLDTHCTKIMREHHAHHVDLIPPKSHNGPIW